MRPNIKKLKENPLDDAEADFVDLDMIIDYYIDEYRTRKRSNQ